jgi:pimeloyl-ACP methyl ester carboxylesterase
LVLAIIAFTLLLICPGAAYEAIGSWRDSTRFPQHGKNVQAGSIKLNLDCSGQGGPTVVLESGGGMPAFAWFKVQPEVAKFTRVCSYDRAGYGWSGPGPEPRTSGQIATELRALLATAGERGPYVMVGHSLGGFNVRVFAGRYPDDVSGVVLVDASHEDQNSRMQNLLPPDIQAQEKANEKRDALLGGYVYPLLIHLGVQRLVLATPLAAGILPPYLSETQLEELLYLENKAKARQAFSSEMDHFTESAEQVRAARNLGVRPLIVLTAGKDEVDDPLLTKADREAQQNLWINVLQVEEAHLSTAGRQIVVSDSGHMIPLERPDAVVSAIREVWSAARQ